MPILVGAHYLKPKLVIDNLPKVTENCIRLDIKEYGETKEEAYEKCFYIVDSCANCYTLIKIDEKYTVAQNGPFWTYELIIDVNKKNFSNFAKPDESF